jgi:hypothetical protein
MVQPCCKSLDISILPFKAVTLSRIPCRPNPVVFCSGLKPLPLSLIDKYKWSEKVCNSTFTFVAVLCLTILVKAS